MPSLLEFEITTTLTGPLAERLVKISARTGKTPVDCMADLMHRALSRSPDIDVLYAARGAKLDEVESKKRALERELVDLRRRFQKAVEKLAEPVQTSVPPGAFVILPCVDAIVKLGRAADRRKLKSDQLARMILEQVASDDLFAAVLDT